MNGNGNGASSVNCFTVSSVALPGEGGEAPVLVLGQGIHVQYVSFIGRNAIVLGHFPDDSRGGAENRLAFIPTAPMNFPMGVCGGRVLWAEMVVDEDGRASLCHPNGEYANALVFLLHVHYDQVAISGAPERIRWVDWVSSVFVLPSGSGLSIKAFLCNGDKRIFGRQQVLEWDGRNIILR